MYRLEKEFRFEAAHRLPKHDGKCARLHGHSWVGYVVIEGPVLVGDGPKAGMLMDFGDMKRAVDVLVGDYLDHYYLNESLKMESPTSERVAEWVFDMLKAQLPGLVLVRIEETCTSAAEYWEDDPDE